MSLLRSFRFTWLWWVVGPAVAALTVMVITLAVRPVPYYTLSPGSAWSVEPLVSITSAPDGPDLHDEEVTEDLFFLTVSVRQPFGAEVIWALTDDRIDVLQQDLVDGTQTREENRRFNRALMTSAKDKAAKVAIERAGMDVGVSTTGAVVMDVGPEYPAAEVLTPGDTIVGADGRSVKSGQDLVDVIATHEPGEEVALEVEPLGSPQRHAVKAKLVARPDDGSRPMLGVSLESRPSYDFPVNVEIDAGDVGGPSAGLAFALAILDRLTPGQLTGGARVAVTGTMELDGTVGRVGGVRQKLEAAVTAGARMMLVPVEEVAEASEAADGRIAVRGVATFDEALDMMVELGGDPVPAAAAS